MKHYSLIIDHEYCWGCKTCEVACKQENHSADGVQLISVVEHGPTLIDGKMDFSFHVTLCRHCDDPPCAEACTEGVITKRQDGIVVLDDQRCTGCGACIDACPYDAIAFDEEKGRAQKCNLCFHRVDKGLIPACADNVCLAHCIYFGDVDEIKALKNKGS